MLDLKNSSYSSTALKYSIDDFIGTCSHRRTFRIGFVTTFRCSTLPIDLLLITVAPWNNRYTGKIG